MIGIALLNIRVRDLPERDIWSLRVGWGGCWEIHVSSAAAVVAAPGLDPPKGGFSGQRFFSPLGLRIKISTSYYRGFVRIRGPRLFCFDKNWKIDKRNEILRKNTVCGVATSISCTI